MPEFEGFAKVDRPYGMLQYASGTYFVTFKGAGGRKGSAVPMRVVASYGEARKVYVAGYGKIRTSRITECYVQTAFRSDLALPAISAAVDHLKKS